MDNDELEIMVGVNLRDTAYWEEEAEALREAAANGRHGGVGAEVPKEELVEDEHCG